MPAISRSAHHVIVPDDASSAQAVQAVETLRQFLEQNSGASTVSLSLNGDDANAFEVSVDVVELLIQVLGQTAGGNAVAVAPVEAELTTQQAADLLNVSRPYFVKLLDQRKIPFRRVGNRRRVLLADLVAFKHYDESERREIAAELTAAGQGHDLEA